MKLDTEAGGDNTSVTMRWSYMGNGFIELQFKRILTENDKYQLCKYMFVIKVLIILL